MGFAYFVRYGLMGQVGRFLSESGDHRRGQRVVIRSHRGSELGEILSPASPLPSASPTPAGPPRLLRAAEPADLARACEAERERPALYLLCQQVFQDGTWPIELVDVEPLLEGRRAVLSYLGPHHLDTEGLADAFRTAYGLDVVLEPVGRDVPEEETAAEPEHSCGSCGAGGGGCGTGGGCDSGGCGDCGVKKLLASRRNVYAH